MRKIPRKTVTKLIIIGLDCLLLFFFLIQSLIIGCLIAYGYIPVPAKWANKKLLEKQSDGFYIQAESFRLKLWQEIELIGLDLYHRETKNPLLSATSTTIQYSFQPHKARRFNLTELALTNGTLTMPAVYAPDGKRTTVLEKITFHLNLKEPCIQINSLIAKHKDIYLRGAIEWPTGIKRKKETTSIGQFYQLIATALKKKENFSPLIQPTLEFELSTNIDDSINVSLILSSEQLKHSKISGNYFSLSTDFVLNGDALTAQAPLLLRAREITFADLDIFAEDVNAHVKPERWPLIFEGILPKFEVNTYRLTAHGVELNAPRIMIEPSAFPILQFSGTTCGLRGSASFNGSLNSQDRSGKIKAQGSIDIFELFPESVVSKLPELRCNSTPFYNLSVLFDKEFEVRNASFYANFKDLAANGVSFDNIITQGHYRKGILDFENIHIDRGNQWVDAKFHLNTQNRDFRTYLMGSVFPKEYNSLLPRWWSDIFKDLHFDPQTPGRGNFAIYGNVENAGDITFFGQGQATNFRYKDAFFDACTLNVRKHQNYVEIYNIRAQVDQGRVIGKLGFIGARKPQKGLLSVRYEFNGSLPIKVVAQALGGELANIINQFELTQLPYINVNGVVFNQKFKDYAAKNFVDLKAKVTAPLRFKGTALDYLDFKLNGQGDSIYLRDVQFGYADGSASAIIDVLSAADATKQMCFQLSLRDANQAKAINNLPDPKDARQGETPSKKKVADPARILGLLDLNLHAKGPLNDIYGFEGYGDMEVRNEELGTIRLLGPLSDILKNTSFSFTSFNLDHMDTVFTIDKEQVIISNLEVNGPRTRITADGTFQLADQALDMDVKVSLFANVGRPDSAINAFGRVIAAPLPNLLSFKLTGTVHDQKIRSKFDPRNLIR